VDSLTQLALGSAVGVAVMGRRTPVWKAALWGGVCGTLPDLDAFIDHGDPIRNMTFHRAESHALFYLTLASPLIAWLIAHAARERERFVRWWLAVWLALVTHPLLDAMTVYGTQLTLPFSDHPYGVGSIFIIDPLYTLPLLVGVLAALLTRTGRGLAWNRTGLALSTAYLAWSFIAQSQVERIARAAVNEAGIEPERILVGPTAFNTILWRVLVMAPDAYYEGFYSLLDGTPRMRFDRFERDTALYRALRHNWHVARIAWFSHGFFDMRERGGEVSISDLRMGQEPIYSFTFVVARRSNPGFTLVTPRDVRTEPNVAANLRWISRRLLGEQISPPPPGRVPRGVS
jgi:inner membrane protein